MNNAESSDSSLVQNSNLYFKNIEVPGTTDVNNTSDEMLITDVKPQLNQSWITEITRNTLRSTLDEKSITDDKQQLKQSCKTEFTCNTAPVYTAMPTTTELEVCEIYIEKL